MSTLPTNKDLTEGVRARVRYRRGGPAEVMTQIDHDYSDDKTIVHMRINGKKAYRKFDANLSPGRAVNELGRVVNEMIDELWPLELVPS